MSTNMRAVDWLREQAAIQCHQAADYIERLEQMKRERDKYEEDLVMIVDAILKRNGRGVFDMSAIDRLAELHAAERERDEARQQEQIHHDNTLAMQKERDEARKQLAELKDWLESAISLLNKIQLQEIGGEIGAELGEDVSVKILPAIEKLKRERDEIAVGLLSTHPLFADKNPERVLAFIKETSK
jgi:hypothetical protein